MGSFLVGLFCLAGILCLAIITKSTSMALLGLTLSVLLVYSFFSLSVKRKKIRGAVEVPLSMVSKDQRFYLQVNVENESGRELGKISFRIAYQNVMAKKADRIRLTAVHVPAGRSQYRYELSISCPGCYEFQLKELYLYDGLGIFAGKERMGSCVNAVVLPQVREIPVSIGERIRNFYGDADIYDELRPGHDPGEIFQVREFRDGDKLPSVLWKLSAKTGELMVKDSSLPKACPVELFLYSYGRKDDGTPERIASLAFSLMDAGCAFYAVWMSRARKDILRTRVDDEESFYGFLAAYLQDCSPEDEVDLEDCYREKYRGEHGLHSLRVKDGRVFLDGQEQTGEDGWELLLD